jgi:pyruvate/2-oxoglutarate dehydrogenase complex dihydrolipoamide dehydrogenase (E3) component
VLTQDRHNKALIHHVHPPDWTNPIPDGRYNLVVIGGGTAGLICALGAAHLGAKVALIERNLLGGDCLNFGCVPSKTLLAEARRAKAAGRSGPEVFAQAMDEVRRMRADLGAHHAATRLQDAGIDVLFGDALFVDKNVVVVEGVPLTFRRAVIATGARAPIPNVRGLEETT